MNEHNFERVMKKIPGKIPVESKSEKQGYIGDLSSKNKLELLDLLSRQDKLLSSRSFINKLPDKGEKITRFRNEIEVEIQKRKENDKLSEMLSKLNINGKEGLDRLEWSGKCAPGFQTSEEKEAEEEDSDDETDPLKILAGHSGAGFHKKKHKVLQPEDPLIKPSDLVDVEINSSQRENSNSVTEDEYAIVLRHKLDAKADQAKERFLPYRTINPPKNKEVKEKKQSKYWEITAATPPLPVHGDTKRVTLEESIHLQYNQQQKFKEVQMKHAAERLGFSSSLTIGIAPQNTTEYRDPDNAESSNSDDETSDHEGEVIDEDDHGGGGRRNSNGLRIGISDCRPTIHSVRELHVPGICADTEEDAQQHQQPNTSLDAQGCTRESCTTERNAFTRRVQLARQSDKQLASTRAEVKATLGDLVAATKKKKWKTLNDRDTAMLDNPHQQIERIRERFLVAVSNTLAMLSYWNRPRLATGYMSLLHRIPVCFDANSVFSLVL